MIKKLNYIKQKRYKKIRPRVRVRVNIDIKKNNDQLSYKKKSNLCKSVPSSILDFYQKRQYYKKMSVI